MWTVWIGALLVSVILGSLVALFMMKRRVEPGIKVHPEYYAACDVATVKQMDLNRLPYWVAGQALYVGSRVLVRCQEIEDENGIWVVDQLKPTVKWSMAKDYEVQQGRWVWVRHGGTLWSCQVEGDEAGRYGFQPVSWKPAWTEVVKVPSSSQRLLSAEGKWQKRFTPEKESIYQVRFDGGKSAFQLNYVWIDGNGKHHVLWDQTVTRGMNMVKEPDWTNGMWSKVL